LESLQLSILSLTADDYSLVALNFAATLLGVLVAFSLTALYDREKKAEQEKEDRRSMLTGIQNELELNRDFLTELKKIETYSAGQIFLWRDAYQSAVNSGQLALLSPKLQSQLGMLYLEFKQLDAYGEKILAMLGWPVTQESKLVFDGMVKLMKTTVESTLILLPKGLEVLEAELRQLDSTSHPTAGSTSSQNPRANRDVDLVKITLAAEYKTGNFHTWIGVYFAIIVGLLVAVYEKYRDVSPLGIDYYLSVGVVLTFFPALLIVQQGFPYRRWMKQLDYLVGQIESNNRIPAISVLIEPKDRWETTAQSVIVFLALLDFILVIYGYSPWQVYLIVLIAGAGVNFWAWIKKRSGRTSERHVGDGGTNS